MKLWGRILWTLLSGSRGRRGAPQGWALNSWKPRSSLSGLLSATEVVSHWTQVFEQRGIPEARESSEYIVAHVLGAKTELVEWILEEVAQRPSAVGAQGGPLILEVGCGSGAIALSLLSQLPESQVIAVDKGEAAVRLTHKNAQRGAMRVVWRWSHGFMDGRTVSSGCIAGPRRAHFPYWSLQPRVTAHILCSPPPPHLSRLQLQDRIRIVPLDITSEGCWTHLLPWGPIDLVVSNPPYVFHKDMEQLAPEICSYEDLVALDGGEEGMNIITRILTLAPRLLNASGSIFLEVDPRHPELVSSWLQSRPHLRLSLVAVRKDFCGRSRFLHVRKSAA
ncbi:MTRF1L release factor glutamine methyltransferase isoform X3 [Chionomys nivalis]|uniref:MTRF1L release factor glutamine methyltransferase isoform X3 n=1 Tax=Chionomys nivalis TaxID=269649 RepID=UPI002591B693|nr:MTRF1L release factor glutamine methyltransferase isoform X3 [Chionomys nivalis]